MQFSLETRSAQGPSVLCGELGGVASEGARPGLPRTQGPDRGAEAGDRGSRSAGLPSHPAIPGPRRTLGYQSRGAGEGHLGLHLLRGNEAGGAALPTSSLLTAGKGNDWNESACLPSLSSVRDVLSNDDSDNYGCFF